MCRVMGTERPQDAQRRTRISRTPDVPRGRALNVAQEKSTIRTVMARSPAWFSGFFGHRSEKQTVRHGNAFTDDVAILRTMLMGLLHIDNRQTVAWLHFPRATRAFLGDTFSARWSGCFESFAGAYVCTHEMWDTTYSMRIVFFSDLER